MNLLLVLTLATLATLPVSASDGTCTCSCCLQRGCTRTTVGTFDSDMQDCDFDACTRKYSGQCPDVFAGEDGSTFPNFKFSSEDTNPEANFGIIFGVIGGVFALFVLIGICCHCKNTNHPYYMYASNPWRNDMYQQQYNNNAGGQSTNTYNEPPPQQQPGYYQQPPTSDPQGALQLQYQKYQQYQAQPEQYPVAPYPGAVPVSSIYTVDNNNSSYTVDSSRL